MKIIIEINTNKYSKKINKIKFHYIKIIQIVIKTYFGMIYNNIKNP